MALAPIQVQLQSKANQTRNTVVVHGVKFAQGEVPNPAVRLLVTGASGAPTKVQWVPKGRRWPDNSIKYAKVGYRASFTSGQEKECTITEASIVATDPFAPHVNVTGALNSGAVSLALTLADQEKVVNLNPTQMTLIEGGQPGDEWAEYERFDRLRNVPDELVVFWIRTRLRLKHGCADVQAWVSWGNSYAEHGTTGQFGHMWDYQLVGASPTLRIQGPAGFAAYMRDEAIKCISTDRTATGATWTLINIADTANRQDRFCIGMAHGYRFAMTFDGSTSSVAAQQSDAWGMAMDWPAKGIMPHDVVPDYPPYIPAGAGQRADGIARLKAFSAPHENANNSGPYFRGSLLNNPNMPDTGDQGRAFGVMKGWPMLRTGHPHMLDVILRDSYQMLCRPNWQVDPDGTPWSADDDDPNSTRDHPDAYIWNGTYLRTSPDKFGSHDSAELQSVHMPLAHGGGGGSYYGPDPEHWEEIWQGVTLFGTWDPLLEHIMRGRVDLWIGQFYTDRSANRHPAAARARGRAQMKSGAFLLELFNDPRQEQWLRLRVRLYDSIHNDFDNGTHFRSPLWPENGMSFGAINNPSTAGGHLRLHVNFNPWQEGEYADGLMACSRVLANGNPADPDAVIAQRISREIAMTVAMFGYYDLRTGSATQVFQTNVSSIGGPQGTASMDGATGRTNVNGRVATGSLSGATGVIWWVEATDLNPGLHRRVHMHSCTGQFQANDVIAIAGSAVVCIASFPFTGFIGATAIRAFNEDNYRNLTAAEHFESAIDPEGNWRASNTKYFIGGDYGIWEIPALVIAERAAIENFYGPFSPIVRGRAREIMNAILTDGSRDDNGTWNTLDEFFAVYAGVIGGGNTEPPAAPDQLVAVATGPFDIGLTWRDNSLNENEFQIERSLDGTNWGNRITRAANSEAATVSGLLHSTLYYLRVRASNEIGDSAWSNVAQATTLVGVNPPTAPTTLAAIAANHSEIGLTWVDTSNNETGFELQYTDEENVWHFDAFPAANAQAFQVGGLAASTQYWFRLRAVNSGGPSAWSNTATATTPASSSPPLAPSLLVATPTAWNTIGLVWQDNASDETGFSLQRSLAGVGDWTTIAPAIAANAEAYTDDTCEGATSYDYRIRAFNGTGASAYSNVANATTPPHVTPPNPPTALMVVPTAWNEARATWSDESNNETGFEVQIKLVADPDWFPVFLGPNVEELLIGGLAESTTYQVRVRSFNATGASAWTPIVEVTTLPSQPPVLAPSLLTATATSHIQIVLGWQDNSNNETGFSIDVSTDAGVQWNFLAVVGVNVIGFKADWLLPETTYHFRVRAFNATVSSPYSNVANATTQAEPPGNQLPLPPTGIVAIGGALQISLTWNDVATNEQGYYVERFNEITQEFDRIATLAPDVEAYINTGLLDGTRYWYRIVAFNAFGLGIGDLVSAVTDPPPPITTPPNPPRNLRLRHAGVRTLDIQWDVPAAGGGAVAGYYVERLDGVQIPVSADEGTVQGGWRRIATLDPTALVYLDIGRDPGTEYKYRAQAFNAGGVSGYSNELTVSTVPVVPGMARQRALAWWAMHVEDLLDAILDPELDPTLAIEEAIETLADPVDEFSDPGGDGT